MAKLHFKYGTMGSSKSAQLLMTRFNYMEKGRRVWLLKPATDTRDGIVTVKSRIGLQAEAEVIQNSDNILEKYKGMISDDANSAPNVIIVDECQFLTEFHVLQLREIVSFFEIPVLCFGLRTDFRCKLFPGSKALFELADEFEEIKSICACGEKATVNARLDSTGKVITEGEQVVLGGNECYESMCWTCYKRASELLN